MLARRAVSTATEGFAGAGLAEKLSPPWQCWGGPRGSRRWGEDWGEPRWQGRGRVTMWPLRALAAVPSVRCPIRAARRGAVASVQAWGCLGLPAGTFVTPRAGVTPSPPLGVPCLALLQLGLGSGSLLPEVDLPAPWRSDKQKKKPSPTPSQAPAPCTPQSPPQPAGTGEPGFAWDPAWWHSSRPREASGLSLCPTIALYFPTCAALELGGPEGCRQSPSCLPGPAAGSQECLRGMRLSRTPAGLRALKQSS